MNVPNPVIYKHVNHAEAEWLTHDFILNYNRSVTPVKQSPSIHKKERQKQIKNPKFFRKTKQKSCLNEKGNSEKQGGNMVAPLQQIFWVLQGSNQQV